MSVRSVVDYAMAGDTRSAALIDPSGSLDWWCLPGFDGEPVFARLVAGDNGGRFAVTPPAGSVRLARSYRDDTAIVETEWRTAEGGVLRCTDGMVADVAGTRLPATCLVREVEAEGRPAQVSVVFDPRFGDARERPWMRPAGGGIAAVHRGRALWLGADRPLSPVGGSYAAEVTVEPGEPLTLVVTAADRGPLTYVRPDVGWRALEADARRWRRWCDGITFAGVGADAVRRSLITLRLLTYSPSGAPVAAPTTSLPELPGGTRNWDYRYAWPRDASIGVAAFLGCGLGDHARAFLYWLLHASRLDRPRLPPVLTLHGKPVPAEREVDWPGFAESRPVRFGNDARCQHQLDTYGWVLDAMWLLVRDGHGLYSETWRAACAIADEVSRRWHEPDAGIWEVRGEPTHWVHSKLMAWLALDRALRIAEHHRTSARHRSRWLAARDAVAAEVRARGFDEARGSYVRGYGRTDLDAALLVLPLLGLDPPDSPRVRGTVDAVRRELSAGGPLLYRYPPGDDGVDGGEGAFLPCSFWLVQALATTGRVDDAVQLFEQLLPFGGEHGLFSEEVAAEGVPVGNYPQALTHAALVQAALAIRDAQEGLRNTPNAAP